MEQSRDKRHLAPGNALYPIVLGVEIKKEEVVEEKDITYIRRQHLVTTPILKRPKSVPK